MSMTIYHRYKTDTLEYWGSTRTINDDPSCSYTTVPLLEELDEKGIMKPVVWNGTGWDIVAI